MQMGVSLFFLSIVFVDFTFAQSFTTELESVRRKIAVIFAKK